MAIARQVNGRSGARQRSGTGPISEDVSGVPESLLARVRSETREFQFSALLGAHSAPENLFKPSALPSAGSVASPSGPRRSGFLSSALIPALVALAVSAGFQASLAWTRTGPSSRPSASASNGRAAPRIRAAARSGRSSLTLTAARQLERLKAVLEADSQALADE